MCENTPTNLSVHGSVSVSQRDRFQGALLGLWLAPTAAVLLRSRKTASRHRSSQKDPSDHSSTVPITVSIPLSFHLLHTFAFSPRAFHQPLSLFLNEQILDGPHDKHKLPCWLASVPALLRYHDSRPRRLQWLASQQLSLEALADLNEVSLSVATEQIVVLGDLLEMALGGQTDPLVDYSTELRRLQFSDEASQTFGQEDLTREVLSISGYPKCYSRLMPMAVSNDEMALMTGLVAGALQGLEGLPVLWQLSLCADSVQASGLTRSVVVDIAGRLFEQWAGMATID